MKLHQLLFMITRFFEPNGPRYITQHSGVMYRGITDNDFSHALTSARVADENERLREQLEETRERASRVDEISVLCGEKERDLRVLQGTVKTSSPYWSKMRASLHS